MYICLHICIYVYIYIYISLYLYLYIYIYIYIYIYEYIFIYSYLFMSTGEGRRPLTYSCLLWAVVVAIENGLRMLIRRLVFQGNQVCVPRSLQVRGGSGRFSTASWRYVRWLRLETADGFIAKGLCLLSCGFGSILKTS